MKLIKGDCIEEMKKMPDNSIDAIITDPPYGLEFMGKEWDRLGDIGEGRSKKPTPQASGQSFAERIGRVSYNATQNVKCRKCNHWKYSGTPCKCDIPDFPHLKQIQAVNMQEFHLNWAKECLRVLKAGGFLLSFGCIRTYHRMTCGIEDAGFEIRDCIMWIYGSGFPKSLNIGKQIDKMAEENIEIIKAKQELGRWLKETRGDKPMIEIAKYFPSKTGGITGCVSNWELGKNLPTWEIWIKLKEVLDLDERFDYLIEGRPKNYIPAEREIIGKNDYTNPKELYQVGKEKEGIREDSLITAPATPEAKEWEGWGTALKPAVEPIVVARKPLSEKNVALNVLKHGTGGMNIDECRIGVKPDDEVFKKNPHTKSKGTNAYDCNCYGKYASTKENYNPSQGRFPANIILDEEAGKMLDEQSGETTSSDTKRKRTHTSELFGMPNDNTPEYSDSGGASRFFYCAKVSKSERNEGLDEFEEKRGDSMDANVTDTMQLGGASLKGTPKEIQSTKNNHPTVKPIKLMEYLIKLITRKGAVVLDPFMGSGTTGIACWKLQRDFIGIEKEEDYVKIAEARIKHFSSQERL